MTRPNATAIVLRADRKPAYATRRTGYVTQELIRQHGSFAKALAVLNAQAEAARLAAQQAAA